MPEPPGKDAQADTSPKMRKAPRILMTDNGRFLPENPESLTYNKHPDPRVQCLDEKAEKKPQEKGTLA